jgi:hypothetical protein
MQSQLEIVKRRAPVCGILSVVAPFASVGVALLVDRIVRVKYPGDEGRFFIIAWIGLPIVCGMIGGMVLAGTAALRDEKWSALPWIGYLVNAGPFLCAVIASCR